MDGGGGASTTASPASKTFSLQVGAATGTKNQIAVAIKAMDASTLSVGVDETTTGSSLTGDVSTNATFAAATATAKAQFTITAGAAAVAAGGGTTITAAVTTSVAAAAANIVTQINDSNAFQALGVSAEVKSGTTDVVQLTQNTTKSHVMSADAAKQSITNIDAAIKTVNTQRSELGAISNRLSHTVSNMTNISTNLSAARGGIEDADFALETTNLAKNQILQQASTAMLAQANASKQNVLSLLQ